MGEQGQKAFLPKLSPPFSGVHCQGQPDRGKNQKRIIRLKDHLVIEIAALIAAVAGVLRAA